MKIVFTHILISGLLLAPLAGFASSVKTVISEVEQQLGIEDTDMYTMVHVRELSQELNKECSRDDIGKAQDFVENVKGSIGEKYEIMSDAAMLMHSRKLYTAIEDAHPRAENLNDADYCTLKYVFYSMQDRLRNEHLRVLEATDIIKDFNGF